VVRASKALVMSEPDPHGTVAPSEPPPQLNPTAQLRVLTPAEATARLAGVAPPTPTPPRGRSHVPSPAPGSLRHGGWTGYAAAVFVVALAVLAVVLAWRG
jgi:hypothetical protein